MIVKYIPNVFDPGEDRILLSAEIGEIAPRIIKLRHNGMTYEYEKK